ncbi:hypothetical protein FVF58_47125 [Paraburkholderia panacisoli]|uniref:Uncharacterized protein n=1 Tax=Paraburkholderia panacisoli TaxID=2603818 RepID=A0A5B0G772_9BURK|nr:hypothetical protein [Paraburkholderia panacisoli]KAA0997890.1 hypothetical protein FVF58_47125 [Paraburkholderia panacisoli]
MTKKREICRLAAYLQIALSACTWVSLAMAQAQSSDATTSRTMTQDGRDFAAGAKCVKPDRISNTHNPVELNRMMVACVKQERLADATFLYAISGVYGRYDTLRVPDISAHQAVTIIRMATMASLSVDEKARFEREVRTEMDDLDHKRSVCSAIEKMGPPGYAPDYMTRHGLGVTPQRQAPDAPQLHNDPESRLRQALTGYLQCPSATASTETRRFGLKAELLVNGKPYVVDYHWRCSRFLEKSTPVSAWSINPPAGPVLKTVSETTALFVRAPSYCGEPNTATAKNEVDLPVLVIKSPSDPTTVQVFNKSITHGVGYNIVVKSESIYPIEQAVDDYVLSPQERSFRALVEDRELKFQSVQARIEPPADWESDDAFKEYLRNKTGIVIAEPPLVRSNVVGGDGAHNFFPFERKRAIPHTPRDREQLTVPLRVNGDSWELQANDDTTSASFFVRVIEKDPVRGYRLPPKITVNYSGVAVPVIGAQEIFDTSQHRLIEFVNSYQPLSIIGVLGVR